MRRTINMIVNSNTEGLKIKEGSFIEDTLMSAVTDITERLAIEFGIEYRDVTYKDLYLKTQQFAKEIDEILSAEITGQENIFSRMPDINSFRK